MKSPAKKILTIMILGTIFFNAGLSFAQNDTDAETEIYSAEDEENASAERKREFWEKLRESVEPREKPPEESENPREVHPQEVPSPPSKK